MAQRDRVSFGWFRRRLLGLSSAEASFVKRGFSAVSEEARLCLEKSGATFLQGFNAALECDTASRLARSLDQIDTALQGFAYEGAAMGLGILDLLTPWNRGRWRAFLEGPGGAHVYMVHVGLGWVWARMRRPVDRARARLDPLLGYLAVDGYGFHEGYFQWPRSIDQRKVPRGFAGYELHAYDQGLGRSLWFVRGADARRVAQSIRAFPAERQADLWSGIGLASTYAGGVGREELLTLKELAAEYRHHLAQGAAFAAKARLRAGNPTLHTETACEVLCARSAAEAASLTDAALEELSATRIRPAYEAWRIGIRERLAVGVPH